MLIPRMIFFAALIGSGVAGVALLGLAIVREKRGLKARWFGVSAIVLGLLAPLGCGILSLMAGRAIVFTGHRPAITYTRYLVVGSPSVTLAGRQVKLAFQEDDNIHHAETWIINDTDAPLQIESAGYSKSRDMPASGGRDAPVLPGKSRLLGVIDHIGPDDPLPTSVSSNTPVDFRTWVTW